MKCTPWTQSPPSLRDPHQTPAHISHAINGWDVNGCDVNGCDVNGCDINGCVWRERCMQTSRDLRRCLSRRSSASTTLTSLVISALCRLVRLSAGSSDSRGTLFFTKNHCYPRVEQYLHDRMVCLLSLRALVSTSSIYRSHAGVTRRRRRVTRSQGHAPSLGRTEGPRRKNAVGPPCITFTRKPGPDSGPPECGRTSLCFRTLLFILQGGGSPCEERSTTK